ncbi:MAG: 6-phosphofructokinase, partial [Dorea sp.]|nr:6-phosphofructokinase [Dorea sp.]
MSKKNVIVGQSGGPTSVINSSLYGVVTEAMKHTDEVDHVYGMVNGIKGFLEGRKVVLSDMSEKELKIMQSSPSSYLGSCRFKLPEDLADPVFPRLMKALEELNVGYFFYIGGNDSMDT